MPRMVPFGREPLQEPSFLAVNGKDIFQAPRRRILTNATEVQRGGYRDNMEIGCGCGAGIAGIGRAFVLRLQQKR